MQLGAHQCSRRGPPYSFGRYHYGHRLQHHLHCYYYVDWSDTASIVGRQLHQGLNHQRFCFLQILHLDYSPLDFHIPVPHGLTNHFYCYYCKSTYIDALWVLTQLFLYQEGQRVGFHPTICGCMPCCSDSSREACALNGGHSISRHRYRPSSIAKWKAAQKLRSTAMAVHCDSYRSHYFSCDSCVSFADSEATEVNLSLKDRPIHFFDQVYCSFDCRLSEF